MFLLILICILLIVCLVILLFKIREKRYTKFLEHNSVVLNKLENINAKYDFYNQIYNFDEEYVYDNENFYENISCEDFLIYQLQFKKLNIENEIKKIDKNKLNYDLYCEDISKIDEFGEFFKTNDKLSRNYLLKLELKLFRKNVYNKIVFTRKMMTKGKLFGLKQVYEH